MIANQIAFYNASASNALATVTFLTPNNVVIPLEDTNGAYWNSLLVSIPEEAATGLSYLLANTLPDGVHGISNTSLLALSASTLVLQLVSGSVCLNGAGTPDGSAGQGNGIANGLQAPNASNASISVGQYIVYPTTNPEAIAVSPASFASTAAKTAALANIYSVTPSDVAQLPTQAGAIYAGQAGNISGVTSNGQLFTLVNVQANTWTDVPGLAFLRATGTTANGIITSNKPPAYSNAEPITPSDASSLSNPISGIYAGQTGSIAVDLVSGATNVSLEVFQGWNPGLMITKVHATGTTATNLVGAY